MSPVRRYSDEEVKEDIKIFFQDSEHEVYQFGNPHECNPRAPYHRKQIEVLFENYYWHWVTDRAIKSLIDEGFLRSVRGSTAKFVIRSDIRYYKAEIKKREKVIRRYSDPSITKAIGDYAEMLFEFMFELNDFNIIDEDTNEFGGVKWEETDHDLDFIIEKDDVVYGVEIKNTLPYMERDEFDIKLRICEHLDIVPLWVLRNAPGVQFNEIKRKNGFILNFKAQIYPPGQGPLVRDIWRLMALPVTIWKRIPENIENIFLWQHEQRISE